MKYLSEIPSNRKQGLFGKLVILLAIFCGQRAREILAVMDLRNICFEKDAVITRIGDLLKTLLKDFTLVKLNFQWMF